MRNQMPLHIAAVLLMVLALTGPGLAQPNPADGGAPKTPSAEERRAEVQAAWSAAAEAATRGPAAVPLRDQATLALPEGEVFIPPAEAIRLSRALGNRPSPNTVGIVTTLSDDDHWIVLVTWTPEGYVRDDEAKDLDADTVLQNLREGTVEANKDRAARGFPELELTGWIQPPHYDPAAHQLAWSLGVREKGQPADEETTVNFNTRALGRDGYFSLNLITGQGDIDKDRSVATRLLAGLTYGDGKRYADFNESTDHVAAYGLAALIGVVAIKKLGFLALAGVFLLKFAKIGFLAVAGAGLAIRKLFRRTPKA